MPDSLKQPTLIMVAPNGARLTKRDAPNVPITPAELAAEAADCLRAGAAAMHLHVRDARGWHSLDPEHYRAAIAAIRAAVGDDLLLQVTSEAAGVYGWREQAEAVRALEPEAVSIALREFLPEEADAEQRREVADFFRWLHACATAVQIICYAPEEVERLVGLREEGVIPWRHPFLLFVLGTRADYEGQGEVASADAALSRLDAFLRTLAPLREEVAWMACAFGPHQLDVLEEAARRGGHVRVGFENGRDIAPGHSAPDNAALVAALAARLHNAGLTPMDVAAARALFRHTAQ